MTSGPASGPTPEHPPPRSDLEVVEMAQSLHAVNVITLFVADPRRSKEFYERVFEVTAVDEAEDTVIFKLENLFVRLLAREGAERDLLGKVPLAASGSGASAQLAVFVDDADALCERLAERGVAIAYGPVDRPWGVRSAGFLDPDGHVWAFSADIPGTG